MNVSDLALHDLCMIELRLGIAICLLPQVENDGDFLCIIPVRANEAEEVSFKRVKNALRVAGKRSYEVVQAQRDLHPK